MNLNKVDQTVAQLKRGEKGIITSFPDDLVPIKLLELGCLPGNSVEVIQIAPFRDPIYVDINGTHMAIRRSMAEKIVVTQTS